MGNEKDIRANILNDEDLDSVSGGKQIAENLVYKKSTKKKVTNTLYSGGTNKASNLLYKSENTPVEPSDPFADDPKLC